VHIPNLAKKLPHESDADKTDEEMYWADGDNSPFDFRLPADEPVYE
jgi:hypothetical protein